MSDIYAVVRISDRFETGYLTEVVIDDLDAAQAVFDMWSNAKLPQDKNARWVLAKLDVIQETA